MKITSKFCHIFLPALFLLFALAGCNVIGASAPTPDVLATIVAETLTSMPATTESMTSTSVAAQFTPIAVQTTFTPDEVGIRYVYTCCQNVNMRVNPGRLFQVSRVMAQGTRLEVLGVAPGQDWLNVRNDEGIIGWVGADFVEGGFDGPPLPVVDPRDVLLVTGTVLDVNANPISGIGIGIFQNPQHDEVHTDETGTYYLFLPLTLRGTWDLKYVSIKCTSNIMDANCQCLGGVCGKADPQNYSITFPLSTTIYDFTWK